MAVSVISQNHRPISTSLDESACWSDDKLKSLWTSLLDLEVVSKSHDDVELEGVSLLLETTFNIFKNLKRKYDETESAHQTLKCDFLTAREDLYRAKENLKNQKEISCARCPELEKELSVQKKKLEHSENRIKSIVSILSLKSTQESENASQISHHTAMTKAYNLVSQMLVEEDCKHLVKGNTLEIEDEVKHGDSTKCIHLPVPGRKRRKPNGESVEQHVGNVKDRGNDNENVCYGGTLAPESPPSDKRLVLLNVKKETIPETLSSQCPIKVGETEKTMCELTDMDCSKKTGDIQTTPQKQILPITLSPTRSPVLGGSGRKLSHKSGQYNASPDNGSPSSQTEILCGMLKSNNSSTDFSKKIENDAKSPSLLKIQPGLSAPAETSDKFEDKNFGKKSCKKQEESISSIVKDKEESAKIQADFWKLKPALDSRNTIEAGSRKLKQTTLSLGCFTRKQDLCTLKEFNGGVRQSVNEGDSIAEQFNGDCDEETSIKLAIQKSLNEDDDVGTAVSQLKDITNSVGMDFAEDDDVIVSSPRQALSRKKCSGRLKISHNRKDGTVINKGSPRKKQITSEKEDLDETLFLPLFTSTLQNGVHSGRECKRVSESQELSSQQLLKEMACSSGLNSGAQSQTILSKQNHSFDRIPDKVSTSPNYKYRRNAVRKVEARQKLDGWECDQCKNYYALAADNLDPTEQKRRLNQCSRHRDKYPIQSNTPRGYWDVNFPDTVDRSESK